jgi:hypothetical protein
MLPPADADALDQDPLTDPVDPIGPPAGDTRTAPNDTRPPVDPMLDNDPADETLNDGLTPDPS